MEGATVDNTVAERYRVGTVAPHEWTAVHRRRLSVLKTSCRSSNGYRMEALCAVEVTTVSFAAAAAPEQVWTFVRSKRNT